MNELKPTQFQAAEAIVRDLFDKGYRQVGVTFLHDFLILDLVNVWVGYSGEHPEGVARHWLGVRDDLLDSITKHSGGANIAEVGHGTSRRESDTGASRLETWRFEITGFPMDDKIIYQFRMPEARKYFKSEGIGYVPQKGEMRILTSKVDNDGMVSTAAFPGPGFGGRVPFALLEVAIKES